MCVKFKPYVVQKFWDWIGLDWIAQVGLLIFNFDETNSLRSQDIQATSKKCVDY
jgi:hypothetical protein